jgi:hypothetical protein
LEEKSQKYEDYLTKSGLVKTFDLLPSSRVQAPQFKLHISYFLRKCKKGKPQKGLALIDE